jgi:hypothetical protein
MRKLAPAFIMTSLLAVGGNALANSTTASPTVSPNTQQTNNQSYSDKSSTSPGTNSTMDDKSKPAMASTTDDDTNLSKTKKKTAKKKLASAHTEPTVKSDPTINSAVSAPSDATKATAAGSVTGKSTGQ